MRPNEHIQLRLGTARPDFYNVAPILTSFPRSKTIGEKLSPTFRIAESERGIIIFLCSLFYNFNQFSDFLSFYFIRDSM